MAFGLSILVIIGAVQSVGQAATIYVAKAGSDANDGLSWATAKGTVGGGLAVAVDGDQVWVAAGTYSESVTIANGVALYGGFAGNETDLAQRDWSTHVTVLEAGALTAASGATVSTRVDGFTIRGGAGIYCRDCSPVISNNLFTNGFRVIYCLNSSPMIVGNTITGNRATGVFSNGGSPVIDRNTITNNTADIMSTFYPGGILCLGGSPTITNNLIAGNSAASTGPAMAGGVRCDGGTIAGNTIMGNTASGGSGGGLHVSGSAVVTGNIIAGNIASLGGGIHCAGTTTISNNTIIGNLTMCGGGGIAGVTSSAVVSNNIVAFNSSGIAGDATGSAALHNNCVYNPSGADYIGLSAGGGDISVEPQLVGVECGQFHLKAGSPCIDAGDDAAVQAGPDIDGEARIQGLHVDIGADEFKAAAPAYTVKITRVSPWGDDGNDGSSWELAKRTVQAGIAAAASPSGGEVWVAAGTYNGCITLKPWVQMYGGFAGVEGGRGQRDWAAHETILDGGGGGSVVSAPAGSAICRVDGFTIRNGTGTDNGLSSRYGGGILCGTCLPTISNNTIVGNTAVVGTWLECGDCVGYGGGIYCGGCVALISNNSITGNNATDQGAGIIVRGGSATILGNKITGNGDCESGGGVYCGGKVTLANNAIGGNYAYYGGGVYCSSASGVVVSNTIVGNTGYLGSGTYCVSSTLAISNNLVVSNTSGIYASGGTLTLRNNCVFNPYGENYTGLIAGTGDISVDPQLLDMGHGDVHLTAGSPCIDAGSDAAVPVGVLTDLAGLARFLDDPATPDCRWAPGTCGTAPIVDMGAFEFMAGDYDRDGDVDLDDLVVFQACVSGPAVGHAGDCAKADFDRDGDVDMDDFGRFQRCICGVAQ